MFAFRSHRRGAITWPSERLPSRFEIEPYRYRRPKYRICRCYRCERDEARHVSKCELMIGGARRHWRRVRRARSVRALAVRLKTKLSSGNSVSAETRARLCLARGAHYLRLGRRDVGRIRVNLSHSSRLAGDDNRLNRQCRWPALSGDSRKLNFMTHFERRELRVGSKVPLPDCLQRLMHISPVPIWILILTAI